MSVVGKIEVDRFNFIWEIRNFENCCENVGDRIQSPYFQIKKPASLAGCSWYLVMYPYGSRNLFKDNLSLFLYNKFSDNDYLDEIKVHCKLSIIDHISNKDTVVWSGIQTYESDDDTGHGVTTCISREELFRQKKSFLVNGTLMIRCELDVDPYCKEEFQSDSNFHSDFENLLLKEKFTDVAFQIGRRKLKAHKLILSARSHYFADFFKHNNDSLIKLTDISYDVMREVLSFIYCEKVNNINLYAKPLLEAAYKYRLNDLKIICEIALMDKLSINSAIDILKIADNYFRPQLKSEAMDFIVAYIQDIIQSDDFKLLRSQKPRLLEEILCKVAEQE